MTTPAYKEPKALDYHIWLCAKLHRIIVKDKARAEEARIAGDLITAKAHDKFASEAMTALSFVESWDIASYNYILRKEAKHQFTE
jgi:hypothetical protein